MDVPHATLAYVFLTGHTTSQDAFHCSERKAFLRRLLPFPQKSTVIIEL